MNDFSPAEPSAWDTARILASYSDVLSTDMSLDSDFFMSGGHSLMAVALAHRLRQQLGVPVTGLEVLDHATPRALIAALRERAAAADPAADAGGSTGAVRDTVLVTGASGAVGSFVVQELVSRQYRVRALVRPESADVMRGSGAEVVHGDLTRPSTLREAVRGADAVIHAACTFTEPAVDVAALHALTNDWQGGPFVFVSSVDAYGRPVRPGVPEGQETEGTTSDYGRGKASCESVLRTAADRRGAPDSISLVRVPLVWGPHRRLRDQLRRGTLGPFYQSAVRGEPILLPVQDAVAEPWFGLPWVGAAALARVLVSLVGRPAGGVLNAVGGHVSWSEYATELVRLLGSTSPVRTDPAAAPALRRPWRYRTDVLDTRPGPGLHEDWRALLASTLNATDHDRGTVAGGHGHRCTGIRGTA
ncbi:NAD-dependent epimerase/dehydratase family protein [Streptomyces shenzhenensis]|uniref:NAD-dependent epimerase/dehydratase family protein n=1 Tax=Streptomyces shenzhenensis TaxID=943815 RepID=UPI0034096B05